MKPSISEQLEPIIKPLSKFLWRFHVIIYSVAVIGGLSIAIFLLSGLLSISSEPAPTSSATFDKKTMKIIKDFRTSASGNEPLTLPAGRSNPFAE